MSLRTTLLEIDYGRTRDGRVIGIAFPETFRDYTLDDALAAILSGEQNGELLSVHSIHDGVCENVSHIVADRIVDAMIRGEFVSPMARQFANYMSRDLPREDERGVEFMERVE